MIKNTNNKKKKKGFTLIELIIVIAIIAILAAIAIPKFGEVRKNANVKSDVANAKTIANAVTALIAEDKLTVPTTTALTIDSTEDDEDSGKIEAYLQNVPTVKSVSGTTNFTVEIKAGGGVIVKGGDITFFPATATDVD
ncbi:prepilin-type N-terminal cleavage/methylation domain-containing protein [Clostridium sartagoforme]|jgi:type IV pilus assembly protein PilA|uniref:prepilin-type N-terminal cleavage/methylation domain-containing protein n=1 Tax=Clostridium sartagoforme TaxID=84031 RepID=UPI0031DC69E7